MYYCVSCIFVFAKSGNHMPRVLEEAQKKWEKPRGEASLISH